MSIVEELRWKVFPVLDDGHLCLVDVMGDDAAICVAARVSFGKGTRKVSEDRDLIRYLMRHRHTSPFEQAEIKLRIRIPMDAWRQYIRHRTANVNEYSTRYSEAIDSQQRTNPAQWRLQATANKQGSEEGTLEWPDIETMMDHHGNWPSAGSYLSDIEKEFHIKARQVYEERIRFGVAREQARKDLPLSTYTEAFWKCDLHNILHFLSLRMDPHAQLEIRSYANIIGWNIVAPLFPLTWEAFLDYRFNSLTLSHQDQAVISRIIKALDRSAVPDVEEILKSEFPNGRERQECIEKLKRVSILPAS